jgi:uncharacterized protein (TIGR03435 family)
VPIYFRLKAVALPLFLVSALLYAQPPMPALRFEVASVKPSLSPAELRAAGRVPPRAATDPARYAINAALSFLIQTAYRVQHYQITGPDWMTTQFVEIEAKLPDGATKEQIPEMLQALLAERFRAVVRRETREEPVYTLTVGKDGAKLKEAAADAGPNSPWFPNGNGGRSLVLRGSPAGGWQTYSRLNGSMVFDSNKITIPELVIVLKGQVDLPVIDMTGLKGAYEVSLPVPAPSLNTALAARSAGVDSSAQASDPSGVNIFKSVETLGLKLEKGKGPVERIVVEHVEKTPTEN